LDVVHTNGGDLVDGNAGIYDPLGHVDFYVNGGVKQPGCEDFELCMYFNHVILPPPFINFLLQPVVAIVVLQICLPSRLLLK